MGAADLLRSQCIVDHYGRTGDEVKRITPSRIAKSDLVISIGKTIPYALVSRIPVYVYDHFGGPGYLSSQNFEMAALYNFTGRCSNRKLSAKEIFDEVIEGYAAGVAFARDSPSSWLKKYFLPNYLCLLDRQPTMSNGDRRNIMERTPFLVQERMLAEHVRNTYRRTRILEKKAFGANEGR